MLTVGLHLHNGHFIGCVLDGQGQLPFEQAFGWPSFPLSPLTFLRRG